MSGPGVVDGPIVRTDLAPTCTLAHGGHIAPHAHPFGQLRYAASGVLITTTDAGTSMAPPNRITWMPAFAVHSSRSHGQAEVHVLSVPAPIAARLPSTPSVLSVTALLREAYLALITSDESADDPRPRLLMEVVGSELANAPRDGLRLPNPRDARLAAITDLLRAEPRNPATLAQLGRDVGASERTLSRLFSHELGMSFHQWRSLLRVQVALLDLADGESVTDTAMRLGWANPSSFIETFTDLVGQTPGRYRSAMQHSAG